MDKSLRTFFQNELYHDIGMHRVTADVCFPEDLYLLHLSCLTNLSRECQILVRPEKNGTIDGAHHDEAHPVNPNLIFFVSANAKNAENSKQKIGGKKIRHEFRINQFLAQIELQFLNTRLLKTTEKLHL
jgi:hypothetical protein